MRGAPLVSVGILGLALQLYGCTGDGLPVPSDPAADAFVEKMVNTAFGKWDATLLCSSTWPPSRARCNQQSPSGFRDNKAALGDLARAGDMRSRTYWAFMRNIKDAYYDVDLTYAKGPVHLRMYVINLDKERGMPDRSEGWQIVWWGLEPSR